MSEDTTLPVSESASLQQAPAIAGGGVHQRFKNILRQQLFGTGTPEKIGRFEIRRQLGMGGMGVVYAAYDRELDREVAVKLIRSSGPRRVQVEKRLRREAQAMARLAHPNVVSVYEVGDHDGHLYVAMELVEGETLRSWQTRQERPWREILAMYIQAGRGLAAAHERGIVHRDFKPDNALVGSDGRARVLDFGLAHTLDRTDESADDAPALEPEGREVAPAAWDTSNEHTRSADDAPAVAAAIESDLGPQLLERLTRTDALMGTVAYMSAEQFMGRCTDPRTDQFSFCVALYEGLYRERPFRGRDAAKVAAVVASGTIRPAPARSRVPAWLRAALTRGLDPDPDRRFPDMDALLAHLGRYRRTRRRIAAGGLALLALGAGLGAAVGMGARDAEPAPCSNLDATLSQSWNPDRAAAMAAAFAATELPYAAEAAASATRGLNGHVAKWSSVRENACRAALVERTQSPELYDLQTACLDRQQVQFSALVDQLTLADAEVVEHAAQAVASLPDSATCENVELLRLGIKPPAGGQIADSVNGLRAHLAATAAQRLAGKYKLARAAAETLVAEARATDYPPVLAEALYELGRGERHMGAGASAIEALQEAIDIAEAHRHDLLAARLWNMLIGTCGASRTEPERARAWFRRARAAIERLGGPRAQRDRLMADAYQGLGVAEFTLGSLADAESHYRRALELRTQVLGGSHLRVAYSLDNLASVLVRRERYEQAAEMYDRSLTIRRRELGERHPEIAALLFNLGYLHTEKGDLSRALEYYERTLAQYRESYGRDSKRTADVLLAIARLFERKGDAAQTTRYARDAQTIYQRVLPENHIQRGKAANTLASGLFYERRYEEALEEYRRALAILDRAKEAPKLDVASCETAIGETLLALGRAEEALAPLQRGRDLFAEVLGEQHAYVAYAIGYLGEAYMRLRRYRDAAVQFERTASIYRDKPGQQGQLAATYFALAKALAAQSGARREARDLAVRAQTLYTSLGRRGEAQGIERWLSSGR